MSDINASFMEFLMPYVSEVPPLTIGHTETPSPLNPLGIKGAGEGGTIGSLATLVGAVEDALAPFGVELRDIPLRPEALRAAIQAH